MLTRGSFAAGTVALLGRAATAPVSAKWPSAAKLGELDHSFWAAPRAERLKAAFTRLGFSLTKKPFRQSDGSLSTFADFKDSTYLEIVEDHSPDAARWAATGCNPEAAGGFVRDVAGAVRFEKSHGIKATGGMDSNFGFASFPNNTVLANVFLYSYPVTPALLGRRDRAHRTHPESYAHRNGALGLREIWIAVPDASAAVGTFAEAGFPVVEPHVRVEQLGASGAALAWDTHRIVVLAPRGPTSVIGRSVAEFGSHPLGVRLAADMTRAGRYFGERAARWGDAIVVGPERGAGGWISFGPDGSWTGATQTA